MVVNYTILIFTLCTALLAHIQNHPQYHSKS